MGVALQDFAVTSDPRPPVPVTGRRWLVGPALVLLASVLFLSHGWRTVAAPFGDSHDGRNAGVWASGSRALREAGPVESRMGTHSPENGVYANHPPLIYVETALAELVAGERAEASRAPAWVGSLLAIVLAAVLLGERGLRPAAAGVAVLLLLLTPMFLVYGTMLDTPVTSLPVGIGLLVLWERNRRHAPVRPVIAGATAAVAVLSGWQSLSLALVLAGWALVRLVRRTGRRPADVAFVAGAVAGTGLLVAWLLWAFGGTVAPLLDQFLSRTSEAGADWFAAQKRYLPGMFGPVGLLGALGLVVALRDSRTRGVAAVAVAVSLPYLVLFRSAAVNHEYWGYWLLLPLAIGLTAGGDRLLRWWMSRGRAELVPALAVAMVAAVFVGSASVRPPAAENQKIHGVDVAATVDATRLDPGQATAWYAGAVGEPAAWLAHAMRRPASAVAGSEYGTRARAAPDDLVLVGEIRCLAGRDDRTYQFRPAGSLAARPPVLQSCPDMPPQPDGRPGR